MSTSTQRTTVDHPYQGFGIVLMVLAVILVAFDLGVLARCGQGSGVCFDTSSHGTSDAALVGFFVLFFIGLMLLVYTEAGSSVTRTESPRASPPVMIVNPASAPAPTPVTVVAPASSPTPAMVTVNAPR
jgi:hypothetical protein